MPTRRKTASPPKRERGVVAIGVSDSMKKGVERRAKKAFGGFAVTVKPKDEERELEPAGV